MGEIVKFRKPRPPKAPRKPLPTPVKAIIGLALLFGLLVLIAPSAPGDEPAPQHQDVSLGAREDRDGCTAALPARGARFSGRVTRIIDGDGLCVEGIEVRVADFYAPELSAPGGREAKAALTRIALGKHASCEAGRRSYDRVVATCDIDGVTIGDAMRRAGIGEGGRGV